jgi:hypothetical protein
MDETTKKTNLDPSLSRRLYRALTAESDELFQLLEDTSMEVLETALKNPSFAENHLLALLKRHDLSEDLIRAIYRLPMVSESRSLKKAVAKNPCTPSNLNMAILPQLDLFELVDFCHIPGISPDQKMAAERVIIQRIPIMPLGNKITLARRGTATVVEALVREGDPRYLEACLENPHLQEGAVFRFLNGPNATPDGISIVARHPRWKKRLNLQLAILKNPRTPDIWGTLFAPHLSANDLKGVLATRKVSRSMKHLIEDELNRRISGTKRIDR